MYILAAERSNSVYFFGMAPTSRLISTANTMAAARMAVEYSPLRNTLPFAEEENLKFFMLFPFPQFQRRFSSPCAVKNKNSMVTVR